MIIAVGDVEGDDGIKSVLVCLTMKTNFRVRMSS